MDHEAGMEILSRGAWLRAAPREFRNALLSNCRWQRFETGEVIQVGGDLDSDMYGLASGIVELRTTLGRADTPIMHFASPVFWFGYSVIIMPDRPHRVEAGTRTPVWLARVSHTAVRKILNDHPQWWQYLFQLTFIYGDLAFNIAADLMIRDSERRCAAVLLRLSGHRFSSQDHPLLVDVPLTQHDLAEAANLSLSSVRKMLQRLASRGFIEQGYRDIVVRAPEALRAFVDQP